LHRSRKTFIDPTDIKAGAGRMAIEKSIRAHSASTSMIGRAPGAFPTIRV
jgi:hypothetical protein